MARWSWTTFCGHNESFVKWNNNDFGHCFEQTAILIPTHILLLVVSSYYIGRHTNLQRYNLISQTQRPWYLVIRFLSTVGLLVSVLCRVVFSVSLEHIIPSYSDGIFIGVSFLTWILHSFYVWKLPRTIVIRTLEPCSVIVSFLLIVASIAVHSHTVIALHISNATNSFSEEYTTYANVFFCIVYLLTLLPKRRLVHNDDQRFRVNETNGESERLFANQRSYLSVRSASDDDSFIAEKDVNCFSWLTFQWAQRLMTKGAEGKIAAAADLFQLPKRLNTTIIEQKFTKLFDVFTTKAKEEMDIHDYAPNSSIHHEEVRRNIPGQTSVGVKTVGEEKRHLLQALKSAYGVEYFSIGILKFLADCLGFAGPVLLNLLVSFVENKSSEMHKGYLIAGGLFLSTFLATICSTQFDYNVQVVGYKMRCAVITSIYRKSLKVNPIEQSKFSIGEIVNFMSTDTDRILNFCPSFHAFWSLPFQIAVSLYLLYQQIGLAFLTGLGFALLLIPINRVIAVKIGTLSERMMHYKDERVKTMNELLSGIRVIKFFAWEQHFSATVTDYRKNELHCLKGRKYLDAMCVFFWATTPVLISILTFTTYVVMGNQLTAAKVFTSLSLFLMLIGPLNAFPWVLNGLVEAWVSLKRVQQFVDLNDNEPDKYYSPLQGEVNADEVAICLKAANFTWINSNDERLESGQDGQEGRGIEFNDEVQAKTQDLVDISLTLKKGHLIGVVGKVGSGKSSLLSAIIGGMKKTGGEVSVDGLDEGFGLAPQEAWIQHGSIRDNILFGCPLDRQRYDQVVDVCALRDDLRNMPAGDATEVGDNGITLSGGQRARVALARAVYQNKSLYLLDDPLSAVDSHVARHIFKYCIMGWLENKTRVLCTHHVHYLAHADWIIVMADGKISREGPPKEVLSGFDLSDISHRPYSEEDEEGESKGMEGVEGNEQLVDQEEKEKGAVKASVYKLYWKAIGTCLCPAILISLFFMQASRNVSDWWLSYWVSHTSDTLDKHGNATLLQWKSISEPPMANLTIASDNLRFYLGIYAGLAGLNLLFTLLRAFLFAYGGICAATIIHQRLFSSILKAPVSFFDVTPVGRIINRFSSDLYSVDDSLPFILNIFLAQGYGIMGTLIVTCYGLPWFALCLPLLAAIYYKIQHYYRHTSRELKRISSVTLSPIYSHFSETITGLPVIRAMRHTQRFCNENLTYLDTNQRAVFSTQVSARWLDFRLRMLGVGMVTALSFIAILQHQFGGVDAGLVGLAISYSLSVTSLLGGVVMSFTETEKEMVSVERCLDYITNTPSEKWEGSLFPPSNWPSEGMLEFDNVTLQYKDTQYKALEGVSFQTRPGENIGIVGRTGAGKSSLFLALFRLVEICGGKILVDDVNLSYLDLKCIRSQFAIIPQDPFLYSGSVRKNLDPTSSYPDEELWSVLDRCHLRGFISEMGGLGALLSQRGVEMSVGQRQLICLARAMLTKAKVLCIDEATASVDMVTDSIIQETIRNEFRATTVLTIAHRINTILDSHRVLVMANGAVAEFAPPDELLSDPSSMFYQMVHINN